MDDLEKLGEMLFTKLDNMVDHDGEWDSRDNAKQIIISALKAEREQTARRCADIIQEMIDKYYGRYHFTGYTKSNFEEAIKRIKKEFSI